MSSLVFWEIGEYLGAIVVIAGVAGEYIADFHSRDEIKARRLGKRSTLVLIVGLAFELIALVQTNIIAGHTIEGLRRATAEANRSAESAKATARGFESKIAGTNERVATAQLEAVEAGRHAAEAGVRAAKANARAGLLELETATQREKAARAEQSLLELRRRLASRLLGPEQLSVFIDVLRQSSAKGPVNLVCVGGDNEGAAFAAQISAALKSAGWPTSEGVAQAVFTNGYPTGLRIIVQSVKSPPPHAVALQHAFRAVGLSLLGDENPGMSRDSAEILVGTKPQADN